MAYINARIFVEKKKGFQTEAQDLFNDLKDSLKITATNCRLINIYDVFDIEERLLEQAKSSVFSEVVVDEIYENLDLSGQVYFAREYLAGQYDQRADSAMQCIQLLDPNARCVIRSAECIVLENSNFEECEKVKSYYINPVEAREKDLTKLVIDINVEITLPKVWNNFCVMNKAEMHQFIKDEGLAMNMDDLEYIQNYFRDEEKRNPTETEIRVLDTYWSDHCRHTTFETAIQSIQFEASSLNEMIEEAYNIYQTMRQKLNREDKPKTLMDMATINARYLRYIGKLNQVEVSEEINACSVYIDVDHNGVIEKWLLMFKNETHNHPTEIEPFGGASTCIGGAIRDPLSGRSYVYQAMRISGSGNIFESIEDTLSHKLPQKIISKKSAQGYSSYGNQIGLATSFVKEIIHPSYVAKHMEVGAVVGATKAENVFRKTPSPNDIILLIGGRTGKDGIGGATGSSREHSHESLESCITEVQKGNAPEERKIQRFFRNPDVTKLIKKCNDFGAGGVSVAIGELTTGLEINLDKVRTKYSGLSATELAISESQERMAVVVAPDDVDIFIALASQENLEAYAVARVTSSSRLVMKMEQEIVVDIKREFIDSGGVRQKNDVVVSNQLGKYPFKQDRKLSIQNIISTMKEVNVASQKGLAEMFDASIGSTTVLMPFGGQTQHTPSQASVQKIPVLDGKTTTCSILAYGFNPDIFEYSPFLGGMYSVLESIAKTISVGGNLEQTYFSFQEYFERLNKDSKKWGKVCQAILGTIQVLDYFEKASIGGKDSMSGSFNDLDVVPTLISFACSTANTKNIITPYFKSSQNHITLLKPIINDLGYPDLESYKAIFNIVEENIKNGNIVSSYVVEQGGIISACLKMSFGNKKGFDLNTNEDLFSLIPGAFIVETTCAIESPYAIVLGEVTDKNYNVNNLSLEYKEVLNAWFEPYNQLYPVYRDTNQNHLEIKEYKSQKEWKSRKKVDEIKVLIPVFPGTNCEYDTQRAFEDVGAKTKLFVFRNYSKEAIQESINQLVECLDKCHILAIPGGFSSGDEPDGSAKFIVNVLRNQKIKQAIKGLLQREGLILGICNGFQALLKSGLLPYGEIQMLDKDSPTLYRNKINRHISAMVNTRTVSNNSPWLSDCEVGAVHKIAVSHGEGRFVAPNSVIESLFANGQVAFQYCDEQGRPTMNGQYNLNGSYFAIEGIVSKCGQILGKMGHSERYSQDVFKNIEGNKYQNIFANGVNYFKNKGV